MNDALLAALARGQSALDAGQFVAAVAAFAAARDLAPHESAIALALANAQRLSGDALGSRRTLLAAQRQAPARDPSIGMHLGAALLDAGAPREAASCFTRVMRLVPTDPAPIGALAGARRMAGDPETAWAVVQQALALAPERPEFLLTAAQTRHDLADRTGALAFLARAEAVRPQHAATRIQRAYSLLIGGASREGWAEFESRPLPVPNTRARVWSGESLSGSTVLVTAEQGVGDQFQFVRFVSQLAERGASRVVVECHVDAISLFSASGFEAVPRGTAPETDWHVPMMSLPYRLDTDRDVRSAAVPYLQADAVVGAPLSTDHANRATPSDTRHIGLVWAGNPAFTGRVTRDLDTTLLPSLLAVDGIAWHSLQVGEAGEIAETRGFEQLLRVPMSSEWLQTARTLRDLDGLVTTDTGIAHLAGAMGVRCWVLLQFVPDWRWGLTGHKTPWYPTMRLVRQSQPGDWAGVIAALHAELRAFNAEPRR